jgi:hypothetical protein
MGSIADCCSGILQWKCPAFNACFTRLPIGLDRPLGRSPWLHGLFPTGGASGVPLDPGEQLGECNPETRRDPRQILEAQIRLAALDGPHEGAVNAAMVREGLLRVALPQTQLADPPSQRLL